MPRIDKQTILEMLPKPVTRALVRTRNSELLEKTLRTRQRRRVRGMFGSGAPIAVDITRAGGLGGIMQNGARALANGRAHNVDVALSFRCSTFHRGERRTGLTATSSDGGVRRTGDGGAMPAIFPVHGTRPFPKSDICSGLIWVFRRRSWRS